MRPTQYMLVAFGCAAALLATPAAAARGEQDAAEPRCRCTSAVRPLAAFDSYDLIFFGQARILGVSDIREPDSEDEFIEFAVEGIWKGPVQPRLRVHTSESDPLCAYKFVLGRDYLVYARLEDKPFSNRYRTSVCARTTEAARALPDLAILGPPSDRPEE
jgi:hypothetical protein